MRAVVAVPAIQAGQAVLAEAARTLRMHGWLHVKGVLPPGFVRGALGARRGAAPLEIAGALARPEFLANPALRPLLVQVLGEGFILGGLTGPDGPPARPSLFGDPRMDARTPPVGLVVWAAGERQVVRIFPGSSGGRGGGESDLQFEADLEDGSCLLHDARLQAAATAPAVALLSHHYRSWYRPPVARPGDPPFVISEATYLSLPEEERQLFAWRFDRYASHRRKLLMQRTLSLLPASVGRRVTSLLGRGSGALGRIARTARRRTPP